MAKSIDVSDLDIYYGDFLAVEGVTIPIPARSVTAFIGPSGCGKSTFLRSLNRMHEVIRGARVEGKVLVDGQDLYAPEMDPVNVRRMIGMVFQRPNPFPTMSIFDNVLAGQKLNSKRMKKSESEAVVERSLRSAGLWTEVKDRLDRPGSSLSGGQQQRLCIARAISVEPEILLMDEPCSALDPISTSVIEDLIHELKESYTIVIVTHNMQQAARVSDETAFFNLSGVGKPGRLIEYGSHPGDLQQPPGPRNRGLHPRPVWLSRRRSAPERTAAHIELVEMSFRQAQGTSGAQPPNRCSLVAGDDHVQQEVGQGAHCGSGRDRDDPCRDDAASDAPAHRAEAFGGAGAHHC